MRLEGPDVSVKIELDPLGERQLKCNESKWVDCRVPITAQTGWALLHCSILLHPNFIYCGDTCFLQTLHWPVCTEMKGAFWMLHILIFSCAVWLEILFGLLHVSLQKRIELPHREQIHGSTLACRACMLFFFSLSYICLYFKRKGKKPSLETTPSLGSFLITANWKPSYKIIHIFFFQRFNSFKG